MVFVTSDNRFVTTPTRDPVSRHVYMIQFPCVHLIVNTNADGFT